MVALAGTAHATSSPHFCALCHEMQNPYYGLNSHFIIGFETPIRQTHPVQDRACLDCHPEGRSLPDASLEVRHDRHTEEAVPCVECHQKTANAPAAQAAALARDLASCESCHQAHADFPLSSGHTSLACADCHQEVSYRAVDPVCETCHQEPDRHAGHFPTGCDGCHDVQDWKPARLENHTFPLDHDEREQNTCQTCHPEGWQTCVCTACRDHDPARIERKHHEKGTRDFQNCVECCPTGREHEEKERD